MRALRAVLTAATLAVIFFTSAIATATVHKGVASIIEAVRS